MFEYKILTPHEYAGSEIAALNALGAEGWELVCVSGTHRYFKRRLPITINAPMINGIPVINTGLALPICAVHHSTDCGCMRQSTPGTVCNSADWHS